MSEFGGSDDSLIFDDDAFAQLDQVEAVYRADPFTFAAKSKINVPGLKQKDLFGRDAIQPVNAKAGPSRSNTGNSNGTAAGKVGPEVRVRVNKVWDRASFAIHGWSKKSAAEVKKKRKGKAKDYGSDEEPWDDEEQVEDDNNEAPVYLEENFNPAARALPIKWQPDDEAIKTWVYPVQPGKELRTYQYNIVHNALFDNVLVALPTGLGKTFIAAVVMLNFYRWYPKGKIIFMAPTRPLVAQQIIACHSIVGIPQGESIELTGQTNPSLRAIAWATKRIIYCTPQTAENDLAKGRVDPRDITCVVVDEAHRASGDYAYCGVIRYLMSRNPHFRVLALTATPGANAEAVQSVIDNLHIGKLEIRTDQSLDIKPYIHQKVHDLDVVTLGGRISSLRDRFGALMQPYMAPLIAQGFLYERDPTMLSPFSVQLINGKLKGAPGGYKQNGKYYNTVKILGLMARAMENLIILSVTSFDKKLKDIEAEGPAPLKADPEFKRIVDETNQLRSHPHYIGHPKMEKLRSMCLNHFEATKDDTQEDGTPRETRVMVFCNHRDVVGEIVECLNATGQGLRATEFVGQAASGGKAGKSQKNQIETIRQFKKGTFNIMVATSIGEEGLDIGEIDLIVCYEASKSPIRMLQRIGRTGRARDGKIIVLMTEKREDGNWKKAQTAYAEVQKSIVAGKVFDLYSDGERLLPDNVKPSVDKVSIQSLPLDLSLMTMMGEVKLARKTTAEEKKAKKLANATKNIPDGAFLGFRKAGKLIVDKVVKTDEELVRERKVAALLTAEEEEDLRSKWQFSESGQPIVAESLFMINPIFEPSTAGSALQIPRHGSRHLDLLKLRRTMSDLDMDGGNVDEWFDSMTSAYNPALVTIWPDNKQRSTTNRNHLSLRPPIESSPELGISVAYTNPSYPIPSPIPSPPSSASPAPSFQLSPSPPASPPPPPRSRTLIYKEPLSQHQPKAILDHYGVLSSSEDEEPAADSPPPSTQYDYDDAEFNISDFDTINQLGDNGVLEGTKEGTTIDEAMFGTIIPESVAKSEKARSVASRSSTPLVQDILQPPQQRSPSPEEADPGLLVISDSEEDVELLLTGPRRLASSFSVAPNYNRKSSPPVQPRLPSSSQSMDYGFEEFDENDLAEVDLVEIAAGGLPPIAGPMLPPQLTNSTTFETAKRLRQESTGLIAPAPVLPPVQNAPPARAETKRRPQHHIVPDSDSSAAPSNVDISSLQRRRIFTKVDDSLLFDDHSPIVGAKNVKRRAPVARSSSPNDSRAVAGPSKGPKAIAVVANKLRRGRLNIEADTLVAHAGQASTNNRTKSKKRRLNNDSALKTGLFELEASESDVDSKASSGTCASEDSDDRRFVAGSQEEVEDESFFHGRLYRESMQTQPQAGFGRPGYSYRNQNRPPVQRSVERGTPRTGSQWSYDSFCVADDDEIEMEGSSPL